MSNAKQYTGTMNGRERIVEAIFLWNGDWRGRPEKILEIEEKTGITLMQINSLRKSLSPYFLNRKLSFTSVARDMKNIKDIVEFLNRKKTVDSGILRGILCGKLHQNWTNARKAGIKGLVELVNTWNDSEWGSNVRQKLIENGFQLAAVNKISLVLLSLLKGKKNVTPSDIRIDIKLLIASRQKMNHKMKRRSLAAIHFALTGVNPTFIEFLKDGEEFETSFCSPFTYRKYEDRIEKADGSVSYDLECFMNIPVFIVER
jgi:hypothetical protein